MKILITAGPTREKLDAVRFLSNRSSGKMGYALAEAAVKAGHEVFLVSGPVTLPPASGVEFVQVESAEEMAIEVRKLVKFADLIIMAAAVADYRPKKVIDGKLKKNEGDLVLALERTEDILCSLGKEKSHYCLVGFAAETDNLIENAQKKICQKNLDWIIANDVSKTDRGFGSENNAVTMISNLGEKVVFPLQGKRILAEKILSEILHRITL